MYFAGVGGHGHGLAFVLLLIFLYQDNHISLYLHLYLYPFSNSIQFQSYPIIIHYIIMYCAVICNRNLSLVTCNLQYPTSDEYHTTFMINQPSTNRLNTIHPSPCVEDLGLHPHLHLQHGIVPPLSLLEMIEVG